MKMWTYTGTISFSAPEVLQGLSYEYLKFVNKK